MTATYSQSSLTLHDQLCTFRKDQIRTEAHFAVLLARFAHARGFRALGFGSMVDYADAHLHLTARQTKSLIRLGRQLPDFPILQGALEVGELGTAKADMLLRIIDQDTEAAWVSYATQVPCKTLECAVTGSQPGDHPPKPGEAPRGQAHVTLTFQLKADDAELVHAAMARLRQDAPEADAGTLLAQMAREILAPARAEAATADAAPDLVPEPRYRVVIERCPDCQLSTHVGPLGRRDVDAATDAEIDCHHETVDLHHNTRPGRLTRSIPETVRRRVAHRDGYQCAVAGCSNRRFLDYHHVIPHAAGGPTTTDNLVLVCTVHHSLHHDGQVLVWRSGPASH